MYFKIYCGTNHVLLSRSPNFAAKPNYPRRAAPDPRRDVRGSGLRSGGQRPPMAQPRSLSREASPLHSRGSSPTAPRSVASSQGMVAKMLRAHSVSLLNHVTSRPVHWSHLSCLLFSTGPIVLTLSRCVASQAREIKQEAEGGAMKELQATESPNYLGPGKNGSLLVPIFIPLGQQGAGGGQAARESMAGTAVTDLAERCNAGTRDTARPRSAPPRPRFDPTEFVRQKRQRETEALARLGRYPTPPPRSRAASLSPSRTPSKPPTGKFRTQEILSQAVYDLLLGSYVYDMLHRKS